MLSHARVCVSMCVQAVASLYAVFSVFLPQCSWPTIWCRQQWGMTGVSSTVPSNTASVCAHCIATWSHVNSRSHPSSCLSGMRSTRYGGTSPHPPNLGHSCCVNVFVQLFGAALTCPLKISEKFYGTGESYLFSFESPTDIKIYYWTGENNYIVKGSSDSITVGCEE